MNTKENNQKNISIQAIANLYNEGKYEELEKECLLLKKQYPESTAIENYYAASFAARGDFKKAEELFVALLDKNPGNINFYVNVSFALMEQKKYTEAIEISLKGLDIARDNPVINFNLGTSYFRSNDNEKAVEYLKKAIEFSPNPFPNAHINISSSYQNLGNTEEAEKHLQIAADLAPNNKSVNRANAQRMARKGNLYDGLSRMKKIDGEIILNRNTAKSIDELKIKRLTPHEISDAENFIGSWKIEEDICKNLIAFFESKKDDHRVGTTGWGTQSQANTDHKDSLDMTIYPNDFGNHDYKDFDPFIKKIESMYFDYLSKYENKKYVVDFNVNIGAFNIQKYNTKGHYNRIHCERDGIASSHKLLAWMTYLNDVEDGGETVFVNQNIEVKPEIGKTLIWPADWTHIHHAKEVKKGNKYIITGWVDLSIS